MQCNKSGSPLGQCKKETGSSLADCSSWPVIFSFSLVSAIAFLILFEWERYSIASGARLDSMSSVDKLLFVSLLLTKTFLYLTPSLLLCAILSSVGFGRTSKTVFIASSIFVYYFMISDMVSFGFSGYHIFDHVFYFLDMLKSPDQRIWQWAGKNLSTEIGLVFLFFALGIPASFLIYEFLFVRIPGSLKNSRALKPGYSLTLLVVFMLCITTVGINHFSDKAGLDRILRTMPILPDWRESLEHWAYDDVALTASAHADIDINGPNRVGTKESSDEKSLNTDIVQGSLQQVTHFSKVFPEIPNPYQDPLALKVIAEITKPTPVDDDAVVHKQNLPNIALVIFESFRPDALSSTIMRKLDDWADKGLRFENHFSGSNCSHLGLFSLFFGRNSAAYDQTLAQGIPPQLLHSLRRSGYEITFITSGEVTGFRRVDKFLNKAFIDNVVTEDAYLAGMTEWPASDRKKLNKLAEIMNTPNPKPQFVFLYVVSSHYGYAFPPEFQIHQETPSVLHFFDPQTQVDNNKNRYTNAMLFLESELIKTIDKCDPKRNLFMITGDHGESMGEDGVFTHGSRMSEVQMRVPFVMVGPGVTPGRMHALTTHADITPTLLHVLNNGNVPISGTHGRDMLETAKHPNEIALAPGMGPGWQGFVVFRENERILYRTKTKNVRKPVMEFDGLVDKYGQYELKMGPAGHIRYLAEKK